MAESGGIMAVVVWPSVVFGVVQFLEGWVLTPWIQSGQTNLSAVTIILVVFISGSVAGVLGMLLAISVAAGIKIICEEVVLPPLRRWLRPTETTRLIRRTDIRAFKTVALIASTGAEAIVNFHVVVVS